MKRSHCYHPGLDSFPTTAHPEVVYSSYTSRDSPPLSRPGALLVCLLIPLSCVSEPRFPVFHTQFIYLVFTVRLPVSFFVFFILIIEILLICCSVHGMMTDFPTIAVFTL